MDGDATKAISGVLKFLSVAGEMLTEKRSIVGNFEREGLIVDTCWALDQEWFETGVKDKRYHNEWIIVEQYGQDRDAAAEGHKRWVKLLTGKTPPKELQNIDGWGINLDPYPLKEKDAKADS